MENPFRPGAGQFPPYLAGRTAEQEVMRHLFDQKPVMQNAIVTGLRGVGKTVLLESFKPIAAEKRWLWVGTDLSESSSVSEQTLAIRILADLAFVTSRLTLAVDDKQIPLGFIPQGTVQRSLDYKALETLYIETPGLSSDKLKAVLEFVWSLLPHDTISGIVFAYDEAQNLVDHMAKEQYPLSVLLEVFQSIQRKGIPIILILTGLPSLTTKLVEARTYSERMFRVMTLTRLPDSETRKAIVAPTEKTGLSFATETIDQIIKLSGGYPFFIQFICKEIFDVWLTQRQEGKKMLAYPDDIIRKLDNDFFQARWGRITDRQRDLLRAISNLSNCDTEFTVQDVVASSKTLLTKSFTPSHVNQMLATLADVGLIYKNRFGKYLLAVPLLAEFIRRQIPETDEPGKNELS